MDNQQINPIPPSLSEPPKNLGWIKWVLIVAVVAILSSGGTYLILQSKLQKQPATEQAIQTTPMATPTIDPTANWKTYDASNISRVRTVL